MLVDGVDISSLVLRHHPLGLDVSQALDSGPEVQDACLQLTEAGLRTHRLKQGRSLGLGGHMAPYGKTVEKH